MKKLFSFVLIIMLMLGCREQVEPGYTLVPEIGIVYDDDDTISVRIWHLYYHSSGFDPDTMKMPIEFTLDTIIIDSMMFKELKPFKHFTIVATGTINK